MRYPGDRHVWLLFGNWRCEPYMRGTFIEKKNQNARSFILSHTCKLNQQKQWDVVSQAVANMYPSNSYDFFPVCLLLTSQETLYNLNIVLSFYPPFEPISTFFTIACLKYNTHASAARFPNQREETFQWPSFENTTYKLCDRNITNWLES